MPFLTTLSTSIQNNYAHHLYLKLTYSRVPTSLVFETETETQTEHEMPINCRRYNRGTPVKDVPFARLQINKSTIPGIPSSAASGLGYEATSWEAS